METKLCKRCGIEKPKTEFSPDKRQKDGLTFYCKECRKQISKEYYHRTKNAMILGGKASLRTQSEGGGSELSKFTDRQILAELKGRGFRWENMTRTYQILFSNI